MQAGLVIFSRDLWVQARVTVASGTTVPGKSLTDAAKQLTQEPKPSDCASVASRPASLDFSTVAEAFGTDLTLESQLPVTNMLAAQLSEFSKTIVDGVSEAVSKSKGSQKGSGMRARGRPVATNKFCHLCDCKPLDPDPVWLALKDRQPDIEWRECIVRYDESGTKIVCTRWAYPPMGDGARPQGNHCMYCVKTIDNHEYYIVKNLSLKEVKELIGSDLAEKDTFQTFQAITIKVAIANCGRITQSLVQSVVLTTSTSQNATNRGKAISVRKYVRKTGTQPPPQMTIYTRINRRGEPIDYVKVYNHSDSEEWSFSETEQTSASKTRIVDDGSMILSTGQMATKYKSTVEAAFGNSEKRETKLSITEYNNVVGVNVGTQPLGSACRASKAAGAPAGKAARDGDGTKSEDEDLDAEILVAERESLSSLHLLKVDRVNAVAESQQSGTKGSASKSEGSASAGAKRKSIAAGLDALGSAKKPRKLLEGKKLHAAVTEADAAMTMAERLVTALQDSAPDGLESLKAFDVQAKECHSKTKDKHHVYLDNNDAERSDACLKLHTFCGSLRDLVKFWKSYAHSYSDKARLSFESSWEFFRPLLIQQCGLAKVQKLILAATQDILKARINTNLNKESFLDAATHLKDDHLEKYELTDANEINQLKVIHSQALFKKIARTKASDPKFLKVWKQSLKTISPFQDDAMQECMCRLTAVLASEESEVQEVSLGLEYIENNKKSDEFVRSIAIMCKDIVAAAASARSSCTIQARKKEVTRDWSQTVHDFAVLSLVALRIHICVLSMVCDFVAAV